MALNPHIAIIKCSLCGKDLCCELAVKHHSKYRTAPVLMHSLMHSLQIAQKIWTLNNLNHFGFFEEPKKRVLRAQCQRNILSRHKFVWRFDFLLLACTTGSESRTVQKPALNSLPSSVVFKDARNVSYVPLRIKLEVLWTDVNYKLFRSFLPFLFNSALLFLIIVKMTIECERDQYIIENKRKPKVTEWGRQRWKMKTLLLQRCSSCKLQVIDVPNTGDQILSDGRRSKCELSNCFL